MSRGRTPGKRIAETVRVTCEENFERGLDDSSETFYINEAIQTLIKRSAIVAAIQNRPFPLMPFNF